MQNLIGVTVVLLFMVWGSWLLRRLPALDRGRWRGLGGWGKAGFQSALSTGAGKGGPMPELAQVEVQVGQSRLHLRPQAHQSQTFRMVVGSGSVNGPLPPPRVNGQSADWGEAIPVGCFMVRVVMVDDPAGDGRP